MAYALVQKTLAGGWTDHILALGGGFLDGIFIHKKSGTAGAVLFLLKNLGLPVANIFGVRVPKALLFESEGALALLISHSLMG